MGSLKSFQLFKKPKLRELTTIVFSTDHFKKKKGNGINMMSMLEHGLQIWSKLSKLTKLAEGRAVDQTEVFECEALTVIASTDTEKKKKKQENRLFSQTQKIRV